ncbi:hypothetical protein U1Q18_001950, partial [Sarracenia purpurea var. burkii]
TQYRWRDSAGARRRCCAVERWRRVVALACGVTQGAQRRCGIGRWCCELRAQCGGDENRPATRRAKSDQPLIWLVKAISGGRKR